MEAIKSHWNVIRGNRGSASSRAKLVMDQKESLSKRADVHVLELMKGGF